MSEQTPATEAGRSMWGEYGYIGAEGMKALILAIEAEARADERDNGFTLAYNLGQRDALREAAERVRALPPFDPPRAQWFWLNVSRPAVLAILDPQP